jgi:hypothetical protein
MTPKKEKTWEYHCNLVFNNCLITKFTITDYFQKHIKHGVTKNIICQLVARLPEEMKPRKKHGIRDVYVWERASYDGRKYRLIFWFKDGTTDHLWIRNCHPQD